MKKLCFLIFVLVSAVSFAAQKGIDEPLKVLAIGNSFSVDAVNQNLWDLASADGRQVIVGNMYIGGCSLKRHAKNAAENKPDYKYYKITLDGKTSCTEKTTLETALKDEDWDVVTLQQQSSDAGKIKSFEPDLGNLITYVRSFLKPEARIVWHMTWAYTSGSCNAGFKKFDFDQKRMYDSLVVCTKIISDRYSLEVIPVGTAIQNVRKSVVFDNVTRDGFHLNNPIGRYAAACTWYEFLFKKSVVGNTYATPHIEPWQKDIVQLAAHLSIENPYQVTPCGPKRRVPNYDESKVPAYTLPDPLKMQDGTPVRGKRQWYDERRPELLNLFAREMYGYAPPAPADARFELMESADTAFFGKAVRKQVRYFLDASGKKYLDLLIYLPKKVSGPVPVFLGINFKGNWACVEDKDVFLPTLAELQKRYGVVPNRDKRGENASRWPIEMILDAGYGIVTFFRGDVDPDFFDGWQNGIVKLAYKKGQTYPEPDQWGTVAQWAWGLSRAMDYIEKDKDIDAGKVAVFGHSRLGKASLWAGANDPRFKIVISNDSGCCGSALSRRCVGERQEDITQMFPHWFCLNFRKYDGKENELPFDQHEILALIAPRPLYIASATKDLWADPEGERLSAEEAAKVYKFLGLPKDYVAYHRREGGHSIQPYDWERFISFADRFFKKK